MSNEVIKEIVIHICALRKKGQKIWNQIFCYWIWLWGNYSSSMFVCVWLIQNIHFFFFVLNEWIKLVLDDVSSKLLATKFTY